MNDSHQFWPKGRAERTIALARLALAACSMLALWIEPSEPSQYAGLARALAIGYTAWAVVVLVVSRAAMLPPRWEVATHTLDIATALLFMNLTAGTDSPFFLYLAFTLMSATLRWDAGGALWTGGAVLAAFFGTFAVEFLGPVRVELNVFIIRSAYLAVLALMLAYLGHYAAHVRVIAQKLRVWQPAVGGPIADVMSQAVRYAADVLEAPRAVIVWEEAEEPDLRMAWWADGKVSLQREDPDAFEPLVSEAFARADFLCREAGKPQSTVVFTAPSGLQTAEGPAVYPGFVDRFEIRTLLAVACRPGRLFIVDKAQLTADDLWLAQTVAHQISASLDQVGLLQRLEERSVLEARGRVARDLHDGLLQSLTAITLRLQTIGRVVSADTRHRIEGIQAMIGDEARRLRGFIQGLTSPASEVDDATLSGRLRTLGAQIEQDWEVRVELRIADLAAIPAGMAEDAYFIVREALINVARHAKATLARVVIGVDGRRLYITVADDGRGFPFDGQREGDALKAANLAPWMLYSRVTSLGGRLVIHSGTVGARVEIEVPLPEGASR